MLLIEQFKHAAISLFVFDGSRLFSSNPTTNNSRAVARKPRDAACFFLDPMTLGLLFASAYERSRPL